MSVPTNISISATGSTIIKIESSNVTITITPEIRSSSEFTISPSISGTNDPSDEIDESSPISQIEILNLTLQKKFQVIFQFPKLRCTLMITFVIYSSNTLGIIPLPFEILLVIALQKWQ